MKGRLKVVLATVLLAGLLLAFPGQALASSLPETPASQPDSVALSQETASVSQEEPPPASSEPEGDASGGSSSVADSSVPEPGGEEEVLDPEEGSADSSLPEDEEDATDAALMGDFGVDDWTAEDFTYGEVEVSLYTHGNASKVNVKGPVVAGLSESGLTKLEENTHLVVPSQTEDGTPLVGVGENAFRSLGLTQVTLPQGTTNFLLQSGCFASNALTEIVIPSGVIQVGVQAFFQNQLSRAVLSDTVFYIGNMSFGRNVLTEVIFPANSVTPVQVDNYAFSYNQLATVRLSANMEKVSGYAFMMNTGNNEASPHPTADCGVVWLYSVNPGDFTNDKILSINKTGAAYSDFQRLVADDDVPPEAWTAEDFTYADTVITGLSESGVGKRADNLAKLVLPDKTPEGSWVTGLADAAPGGQGLFGAPGQVFEAVVLPARLESIGDFAFQANKLSEIAFPSTLKSIRGTAFQNNRLMAVDLPDSVTSLGQGAFASQLDGGVPTLTRVTLSKNLTVIPGSAFLSNSQNTRLTTLVVPEGVTEIGASAFGGAGLTSLSLPSSLQTIGTRAFTLHLLESLELPAGLTEVGQRAFQQCVNEGCNTLITLKLNSNLRVIGDYAFSNADLTEVDLPRGLEKLPRNVFANNGRVVTLYTDNLAHTTDKTNFPDSSTHIIRPRVSNWEVDDFTYDGTVITGLAQSGVDKRPANLARLVLPDKTPEGEWVTGIANGAAGARGLFAIVGEEFEAVVLPIRLESIGNHVFQNNRLSEVEFPATLQTIGNGAFQANRLVAVDLPNSVTTLGTAVFAHQADSGEATLAHVTLSKSLTIIPASAFVSTSRNPRFSSLVVPDGVTEIAVSAFGGAGLTSLYLPDSLQKIGNTAFNQHLLESLELPAGLKSIGTTAFGQYGSPTLTSLVLNEGLETIGNYAFRDALLTEVDLPYSLTSIGKSTFQDNGAVVTLYTANETHVTDKAKFPDSTHHTIVLDELAGTGWHMGDFTYAGQSITGYSDAGEAKRKILIHLALPNKTPGGEDITAIADEAFAIPSEELGMDRDGYVSPYGLLSVTFPQKLESIGKQAFIYQNFTSLTNLPDTVQSIGMNAFSNNQLVSLVLPDSVISLGEAVFSSNFLASVTLSKNLTSIPSGTFSINRPLRSIVLHEGITEIGDWAFNGCAFQALQLPSTLQKVGRGAFYYHQVTDLTVPSSVESISPYAFECSPKVLNLSRLTLEEGIRVIGSAAFRFGRLSEVSLPNSLEKLASDAFQDHAGYQDSGVVRLNTQNPVHVTDVDNFPASRYHTLHYTGPALDAAAPVVITQPAHQTVEEGESLVLRVEAISPDGGTLTYQWYVNDAAGSGATTPTYTPDTTQAGSYRCHVVVTNTKPDALGQKTATTTSETAMVAVTAKEASSSSSSVPSSSSSSAGSSSSPSGGSSSSAGSSSLSSSTTGSSGQADGSSSSGQTSGNGNAGTTTPVADGTAAVSSQAVAGTGTRRTATSGTSRSVATSQQVPSSQAAVSASTAASSEAPPASVSVSDPQSEPVLQDLSEAAVPLVEPPADKDGFSLVWLLIPGGLLVLAGGFVIGMRVGKRKRD